MLCAQAAQQTLRSVYEAFESYRGLMSLWLTGGLEVRPKEPSYRERGGLFPVTYPVAACTFYLDRSEVRIPLGNGVKHDSGLAELFIPCPYGVKPERIKEVQILPRNGTFYAVYVYKNQSFVADVDFNIALGETALQEGFPPQATAIARWALTLRVRASQSGLTQGVRRI